MKRNCLYSFLLFLCLFGSLTDLSGRDKKKQKRDSTYVSVVDTLTDEFLDSLDIKKSTTINDYMMFGFQYGVSLNKSSFNPSKQNSFFLTPAVYGVTFTHYGKMFGYMPYFGYQIGIFKGQDGYEFKANKEGSIPTVDGCTKAIYDYIEVPVLVHMHADFWHMKLMANVGPYVGYRTKVQRWSETGTMDTDYANKFFDYDKRLDYGIKGGGGLAFIFDPIEFHLTGMVRYGFGTLYKPDYHSEYYYRFAYPFDVVISAGIHIQLTKRTGKTKAMLRKEAYDIVFPSENTSTTEKN